MILVGEIRDKETAEIAIQSSLTGHLVFSTLHTNDAASAVTRLIDMGIEPFLMSSSVIAIIAQRLVRVLCPKCREPYARTPSRSPTWGSTESFRVIREIYRKKGARLHEHGISGENGDLRDHGDGRKDEAPDSQDVGFQSHPRGGDADGMTTLMQDGARKVLEGTTTIEEVLRVTRILKRENDLEV